MTKSFRLPHSPSARYSTFHYFKYTSLRFPEAWKQLTEKDCREWKLSDIDPHDRYNWRSGVRSAMCAANQEEGPLMWKLPLYLHVNQKSDDDDDDDDDDDKVAFLFF